MFTLPPELKAKGEQAEADFQDWLNRSGVASIYIEQSPLTVPTTLRGRIKRPDYIVGIPHAGSLAFDVKAKSIYDGELIFDLAEVGKLALFGRLFNLTIYFACIDPERGDRHWWVPLRDLQAREPQRRGRRRVLTFHSRRVRSYPSDRSWIPSWITAGVAWLRDSHLTDIVTAVL